MQIQQSSINYPANFPINMSGKLTSKITLKKDYIRKDGTCAMYVQVFLDKKRKRVPLGIFINPKQFDDKNQRIRGSSQIVNDYNLLIGKKLSDINNIAISYRLGGRYLTLDKLLEELTNPTAKTDFLVFYENEITRQKEQLSKGTYRQQYSTLTKLKKFKSEILFQEITEDLIIELTVYCKKVLKNKDTTIQTTLKNFKKYLHVANKKGINTPLSFENITIRSFKGDRTFLNENEIKILFEYRESKFISESIKNILDRFLFACFTGLRISDIQNITIDNIIGDFLAFKSVKTGKFQKVKLNESAKKFINEEILFYGKYTNEHINRELKSIAKSCNIKKHLTFHVSRHTFATNYLIKGGRVENLQKTLAHSNIRETMIYVHTVEAIMNSEIINLDSILD